MADEQESKDAARRVHRPSEGEVPLVYWEEQSFLERVADRLRALVGSDGPSDGESDVETARESEERGPVVAAVSPANARASTEPPPVEDEPVEMLERATLQLLPGRLEPVDSGVIRQEIRFLKTPHPDRGVTLGWDPGSPPYHITLDHPSVQPLHARMRYSDGRWWIEALSARHPVVVNGERLAADAGPRRLEEGDRVRLGQAEFRFVMS